MQFGKSVGTACSTFAITNIDDLFVLVTFFAEATTSATLSPLKITIGQYLGFTIIVIISMIGFGVSLALPSEPIGFLGLLPILLGVWKLLEVIFPTDEEEEAGGSRITGIKSIFKVSAITVINGGDNIGTYVPLFSQAKGAEIAVYVVVYYILLGVWCFAAWLLMGQKHALRLVEKHMNWVIPFLYIGLGIYITIKSDCYPWSIKHINNQFLGNPGKTIMGVVSTAVLLATIGAMLWFTLRKRAQQLAQQMTDIEVPLDENTKPSLDRAVDNVHPESDAIGIVGVDDILPVDDTLRRGGDKNQERSVEKEV
jgi:cadmium resistance protein CadD (predicted permease)